MFKLFKKKKETKYENKKDWLAVSTVHERYSFETTIHIWRNMRIEEILSKYSIINLNKNIIKKNERESSYLIDLSAHSEIDNKYTYPELDKDKIQHIDLDSLYIIPIDKINNASYIWGATESKFGLLDIKR